MAVCYFNDDYKKRFNCEYELNGKGIEVIVDYEINDEIPSVNGVKSFGKDTEFDERDILIVDYTNKRNLLLKNAGYRGHTEVWGTPDGGSKTKFYSSCYFTHGDYDKLCELPRTPKVKKIKIFSNVINNFIGCPSLSTIESEEEFTISLKRESQTKQIELNRNYIKNIIIGDSWNSKHSFKDYNIDIKLNGYIEIELMRRVNYDKVYEFVYELIIFMQLLYPNKMNISKIHVMVNDKYYELFFPLKTFNYENKYVEASVKDDILVFLEKCYNSIPYKNSKTEIRNIPYIVLNTSRGLEDNFLMFYRFIECYYKKQNIVNNFINHSIANNYKTSDKMTEEEIEKLSQQIVSLRNQYVHSGYYIKNNSLKIKFKDLDEKTPNPKNYTENNVDVDWIYNKTKILYDIVINIIFENMLGYKEYKYKKHF